MEARQWWLLPPHNKQLDTPGEFMWEGFRPHPMSRTLPPSSATPWLPLGAPLLAQVGLKPSNSQIIDHWPSSLPNLRAIKKDMKACSFPDTVPFSRTYWLEIIGHETMASVCGCSKLFEVFLHSQNWGMSNQVSVLCRSLCRECLYQL